MKPENKALWAGIAIWLGVSALMMIAFGPSRSFIDEAGNTVIVGVHGDWLFIPPDSVEKRDKLTVRP